MILGRIMLKTKRSLPSDRNYEQVYRHYVIEKQLAQKLMQADREDRKLIYATMYDELFAQVPDHPRLTARTSERLIEAGNRSKFGLIKEMIGRNSVMVEFAPGDCVFAKYMAQRVDRVLAIDISDQSDGGEHSPPNFELVVYDGYELDLPAATADLVFSDQLIEHFHPEDLAYHFSLVHKLLKPSGVYVFRTPHAYTGPHDVSKYFSDKPEGFHLKEWTYHELIQVLQEKGYRRFITYWYAKGIKLRLPLGYFYVLEKYFNLLPQSLKRLVSKYFLPNISMAAYK